MSAQATWAIVAVKRFSQAKLRLSPVLSETGRIALTAAMLEDLLDTLQAVPEIDAVCVISDEPSLHGGMHPYHLLRDPPDGSLNDAVRMAVDYAKQHGAGCCAVLHADLPLATPAAISTLLQRHRARGIRGLTLVPDRHGAGTNVMICSPADVIPYRYGDRSLAAHEAEAARQGLDAAIVPDDALALDIDEPDDLQALLAACRTTAAIADTGTRTRAVLAGLDSDCNRHVSARQR